MILTLNWEDPNYVSLAVQIDVQSWLIDFGPFSDVKYLLRSLSQVLSKKMLKVLILVVNVILDFALHHFSQVDIYLFIEPAIVISIVPEDGDLVEPFFIRYL